MKRVLLFSSLVIAAAAVAARQASPIPATPVITEPSFDSETISPYDVHMVAGPFVGAPGENHVCSDWQIQTPYSAVTVWTASCVTGTLKVHIHLGDGTFVGTLAGQHQLIAGVFYKVRVRFKGDQPAPDGSWSDWAERLFYTAPATSIEPLVLSDVSVIPAPRLQDESGDDVILPAGAPAPSLRLEVKGGGTLLEFDAIDGSANGVRNPPALAAHGPLHVVCDAGGAAALAIPASRVSFTDGSGADRAVYLPPISLSAGQSIAFWISESGGAFADAGPPSASPDFTTPMSESPVPWAVKQPGFLIERVATGFQLPVDIAFIPTPAAGPDDPLFYVTELYGSIKLVTRAGDVSDYATSLLNFDPTGPFPGSGEKGLTGIVVEPQSGDLFASMVYALPNVTDFHFPKVVRLHSTDGGRTSASQATILDFPNEPLGPSHQISNLSIGPDGKLYVHIGDGLLTTPAEDLNSVRGKILRVNFDGSAP
ncbi:MAG TPA: PQQ-dependent sugar dehydrogenase, partial [Thermoanaerobaculia bacterium]